MSVLQSQKRNFEKEKQDYLMGLIIKIHKKEGGNLNMIAKEENEIEEIYLEQKGYTRFGNFCINEIVYDYLYLIEDFLLRIEKEILNMNPAMLIIYFYFQKISLRRDLTSEDMKRFKDLVWLQANGDSKIKTISSEFSFSKYYYYQ